MSDDVGATQSFYGRWARAYDLLATAPGVDSWRDRAADALALEPGDTVVEMGCGTGANFSHLRERVGAEGRVVGVDLTRGMLRRARERVDAPAATLDLHATVLDYAGVDPGDVDSRSMRPFLSDAGGLPRDVVYAGLSTWRMVFDGRYKLVRGYDPDRRRGADYEPRGVEPAEVTRLLSGRDPVLYDVDAGEGENVAPAHPEVVDRLTDRLAAVRGRPETEGYGWRTPDCD